VELVRRLRIGGEKVGAIQTGTLGFFVDGVVNLDGKVNVGAYRARKNHKLLDYVLDQDIKLLVDFNAYLQPKRSVYFSAGGDPARFLQSCLPRP